MAPSSRHLHSQDEDADEATVVHFAGGKVSLDDETLQRIRDQLVAFVEEPGPPRILLDFSNVEYVSSRALGTLVSLHKKGLAAGRRLILRNLSPQVDEVFAITRLDQFLDVRPTGEARVGASPRGLERQSSRRGQDRWIEIPCKEGEGC